MSERKAQAVTYFAVEDVPGKYFGCAFYGTLSVNACARNFIAAPDLIRTGRLQKCIDCSVGRLHAGPTLSEPAAPRLVSGAYRTGCVRCRRDGRTQGTRLIGRLRLVRGHSLCVSCFNREREIVHGMNAKGARPKKWSGLFRTQAAFVAGPKTIRTLHPTLVFDRVELALTLMRRAKDREVVWARPMIEMFDAQDSP
jgi:RNase P/RNase MRP subunit POP5